MSSDLPPTGPPPPLGPMPSGPPPEWLQQGGGQPVPGPGLSTRRKLVIGGGVVVGVGAVTAAVFGAMWYFGTGPQPAEALPDSTIAYLSVDIDPSGQQLLEARDALESFPIWTDQEISDRDDLREAVFDEVLAEAPCDLDYGADVEPWLGDRAAVAAVDLGHDEPDVVFVVQVTDADQAEDAFEKFIDCGSGGVTETAGWAISGEWAVLAETEDIATQVAEDAQDDPLSDDDEFEKWTDAAGDPGILTAYVAPEAGAWLADQGLGFFGGSSQSCVASELGEVDCDEPTPDDLPDELESVLDGFEGAALTVRFDDGGLEVESATSVDVFGLEVVTAGDQAGESIETLPDDTAAAISYGFEDGWFEGLLDYAESSAGMDFGDLVAEAEDELGLDLPDDAETLAGESAVLAVGGDVDLDDVFAYDLDVTELPIGLKIKGDADAIEAVIDKLLDSGVASDQDQQLFVTDSEGGFVVVGPDDDYREQLLDDGGLGGSDTYQDVVPESGDAASIVYVNFDAGGGWLEELFAGDEELQSNAAPLRAAGLSMWADDGVGHARLRVTVD